MDGTVRPSMAPVGLLEGVVRPYAWGSRTAIARLRGRASPTAEPEAELWFGAHPSAPARLRGTPSDDPSCGAPLDAIIAADPVGALGAGVVARYGPRLPFLLKVLAIDRPLSLQAHPSAQQAIEGHRAEDANGVPLDAAERTYRDTWPKPELICALTPVDALCGFRDVPDTLALLAGLGVPALDGLVDDLARAGPAHLAETVRRLLLWPVADRTSLVSEVVHGARRLAAEGGTHAATADWIVRLGTLYPVDPGVAVTTLMHHVRLRPGEALALPAGNLHAYLGGTAIEVMASSDNVLRGGLTGKHVDVDGLLAVLDPTPRAVPRVPPVPIAGGCAYPWDVPQFALERLVPDTPVLSLERRGPEILLAVGGDVKVVADGCSLSVRSGQAAFVPARTREVALRGEGPVFRAMLGASG